MSRAPIVLVADDDDAVRALLVEALRAEGVRVTATSNGQAALDAAGLVGPAAVLLDIVMPRVDGFEVARRLKAAAGTRSVPILAISAHPVERDALAAGCDAFLAKPFRVAEVVGWVQDGLR
jgi:CheY-like chemotaxis protein